MYDSSRFSDRMLIIVILTFYASAAYGNAGNNDDVSQRDRDRQQILSEILMEDSGAINDDIKLPVVSVSDAIVITRNMWAQDVTLGPDGYLYVGTYWNVGEGDFNAWYMIDVTTGAIVDSFGTGLIGATMDGVAIPPGGDTLIAPRGAAWTASGDTMYTADIDGECVKRWTRDINEHWVYESTFLEAGHWVHGVQVDPSGRVWVGFYALTDTLYPTGDPVNTGPIRVYEPDGTEASFSPINIVTVDGAPDTLEGNVRGLYSDQNGDIMYSSNEHKLYRIDYTTGASADVISLDYSHPCKVGVDDAGYIYMAYVLSGNPLQIFDPDMLVYGQVDTSVGTLQRSVAVSPDGRDVYVGAIYSGLNGVRVYHSDLGPDGMYSLIDTIGTQFHYNQIPIETDWYFGSSLNYARHGLDVVSHNGKIYAIGGWSGDHRLEVWENDSWVELQSLPQPQAGLAAALVDSHIYAFGSYGWSDVVQIYDINTNSWSTGTSIPRGLYWATAEAVGDNIFLIGGYGAGTPHVSDTLYIYDTNTDTWTYGSNMPHGIQTPASAVIGNQIYVFGPNYYYKYDIATNSWISFLGPPSGHGDGAEAVTVDDKIYLIGGNSGDIYEAYNTVEIFDPRTQQWTSGNSLNVGRYQFGAVFLNNKIFVIGGRDELAYSISSVEILDISALPGPRIGVWPSSLEFEHTLVGELAQLQIEIANLGDTTLIVDSLWTSRTEFGVVDSTFSLEAGESSIFIVTFAPLSEEIMSGSLYIASNDSTNLIYEVDLTGVGLPLLASLNSYFIDDDNLAQSWGNDDGLANP
ncbi:MAG: hypothetical protein KAU50_04055, partial [Candidatus Marinimicrobia bacterium]|nr:hypothetical protein [Candidatus Neomarinimicrobiota bacterium]